MATVISFFKTNREPTMEQLECFFCDIIPLPRGFRTAVLRKSATDPRMIVGFSTWASIEDHTKFADSARYPIVISSISRFGIWPPYFFHVNFEQGLPHAVFHCSIAEVIILKRRDDVSPSELMHSLDEYLKFASANGLRCYYYGSKYEDPTVFVILSGWDSKEAQMSMTSFSLLNQLWRGTNSLTIDNPEAVRHVIPLGKWGAFREMELQVKRRFNLTVE